MDLPQPHPAADAAGLLSPRLLRLAGDDRLAALMRKGNHAAFEAAYDRHHRAILSFCRHMLGNREDAEDAVQHTFLAAHAALGRSAERTNLRAWLFTIARNRCLDLLRARRDRPSGELAEPSTKGLAAEVERRNDLRALLADLGSLPEAQRAALVLSELRALPHSEVAEVIGVPPAKVKALVFQARRSLGMSRQARETPCADIREQLATLSGGALRRAPLRRHVQACPGCRAYREEVRRQRQAIAVLLPVAPTAALKGNVLGALLGGGGGGAMAGGAAIGGLAKSVAAKYAVVLLVAGGGAAATVTVVEHHDGHGAHHSVAGASPEASVPARGSSGRREAVTVRSGGPSRVGLASPGSAAGGRPAGARDEVARRRTSSGHGGDPAATGGGTPVSVGAGGGTLPASAGTSSTRAGSPAQGTAHRSAIGSAHAAAPVRAAGRTAPRSNARGQAVGPSGAGPAPGSGGTSPHGNQGAAAVGPAEGPATLEAKGPPAPRPHATGHTGQQPASGH